MRKLFLLIPALVLALVTNAAVTNIDNSTADALRLALHYASDGDVIVMAAGVYEESNSNYIAFDAKNVTVKAADGANVIIKPHVSFTVSGGARAELKGVKIDASELGSYGHLMYPSDGAADNRLILDGCEIYGYAGGKAVIASRGSNKLDSLIINNCKFYNHTTRSCVFLENTENKGLIITNSTFYNIATGTESFSAGIIDDRNASAKVRVDHCTFYNVVAQNTDYAAVGKINISDGIVSNSIFMLPENVDGERAIRGLAQANNCLTYNYIKDSNWGIHSSVAKSNCIKEQDPLFADAANGDFTLANNWVTMNISPAIGAGTDGSDLGDPRWHTAGTLPTTDFASPYLLKGDKAKLSGNIWYDDVNDYLYGDGAHNQNYGTATWKLHAERACVVGVALNLNTGNTSSHTLRIEILDADGNSVGEFAEATSTLPGVLSIPTEGDYTIILHEDHTWASTMIDNITLSYIGGAVQNMPGTTNIADAWFSANGTRADGKIDFPDGYIQDGWVKWNVSFADAGNYNVTVNIDNANGHWYTVALYEDEDDLTPITVTEGAQKSTVGTLELGALEVPAGNYIMKVTNATQYSDAKLISVKFEYAGGAAVDLSKDAPANLLANADAIVSDDWSIEGGKIVHPESKALTGWAKWNVNSADYGNYNVTVNIASDNGHLVRVEIFEDENEAPIYTLDETSATQYHTGDQAIDLGNIVLDAREYVVKVSNTGEYSHVQIASIVISYLNGARATLPASCTFADLMLSEKAHVTDGNLWFNTIGDSNPVGQWAKWNVKVAEAGTFLFTMNVSSTNGQSYKISILDMNENELDAFESGSVGSGDKEVKHYFNLAAGNYIVKLENSYAWSQGHIVSLVVTQPSLLILDEAAETNTVIVDNYRNGTHDIQIIRTIVADMYNTICLPFDVNEAQLKAIFGSDVKLKQLSSAELNGEELDLIFDDVTSGIYRGTPYLIKTSSNVVNPTFVDVEIKEKTGQATSCTNADFIGSFIKGEVPAGENNLFLGPNDLLYFSQDPTPIKGMRAWFQVKGVPNAMQAIKRANIVTSGQVITSVDFVKDANNGTLKTIENGQVIIIRDGIRYNVMGIKLQ